MSSWGYLTAAVARTAPKLAGTTPTGAAVAGGLAYAAVQLGRPF